MILIAGGIYEVRHWNGDDIFIKFRQLSYITLIAAIIREDVMLVLVMRGFTNYVDEMDSAALL
jgi:hypothetical protein